ncbi:MAG: GNAT family N-acetyltransferase [Eubacteriales bacterium]|nr:GNAT family N-acetyltransferase [Eubacteriales bacterium]
MNTNIKTIEDLSLNAWPSHQIQIYDGWLLRFSYFYTHRTNSVEQIGPSMIPLDEKIAFVEDTYRRWGSPAIFKITPLLAPGFDSYLEDRGYITEHITDNMVLTLPSSDQLPSMPVRSDLTFHITNLISQNWIDGLFSLKQTTNIMHRQVVPSMYKAIPKQTIALSVLDNGKIIGTGLGILDRDYIGIYAIHVHQNYRRRGLARDIVSSILYKGREYGASEAYLQVVRGNTAAVRLYESLGFRYLYTDSFRIKYLL